MPLEYVDYGTAPVQPVESIARIDQLGGGNLNLAWWAWRTTLIDRLLVRRREVVLNMVMHRDELTPLIDLCFENAGPPGLLTPASYQDRVRVLG